MVVGDNVCIDALAFDRMRISHNRRFDNIGVHIDCIFYFGSFDAVPRYVQYIIDTPRYPLISLFATVTTIAGEVLVVIGRKVSLSAALTISPCGTEHAWPRVVDPELTRNIVAFDFYTMFVHQTGLHTRHGEHSISWALWCNTRNRCNQVSAVFCLPPSIDDRTFFFTYTCIIPVPSLFVDRLAHGTQHAKRRQIFAVHIFVTKGH